MVEQRVLIRKCHRTFQPGGNEIFWIWKLESHADSTTRGIDNAIYDHHFGFEFTAHQRLGLYHGLHTIMYISVKLDLRHKAA